MNNVFPWVAFGTLWLGNITIGLFVLQMVPFVGIAFPLALYLFFTGICVCISIVVLEWIRD